MVGGRIAAPFDVIRATHAEMLVTDLERSQGFYVGQLGLVVTEMVAMRGRLGTIGRTGLSLASASGTLP
jgi:catechol 2,3-dioxygenase-like lactoylglutathione lyase family enzyme